MIDPANQLAEARKRRGAIRVGLGTIPTLPLLGEACAVCDIALAAAQLAEIDRRILAAKESP